MLSPKCYALLVSLLVLLLISKGVCFAGQDKMEKMNGCVCMVDTSKKTLMVLPWSQENKSWLFSSHESFVYTDDTSFGAGNGIVTGSQISKGAPITDNVKDLLGLVNERVTIYWVERKGTRIAKKIEIMFAFGGEELRAMTSMNTGETRLMPNTCSCKTK